MWQLRPNTAKKKKKEQSSGYQFKIVFESLVLNKK